MQIHRNIVGTGRNKVLVISKLVSSTDLQHEIETAINFVKESVKWRPNKDKLHLEKRVRLICWTLAFLPAASVARFAKSRYVARGQRNFRQTPVIWKA